MHLKIDFFVYTQAPQTNPFIYPTKRRLQLIEDIQEPAENALMMNQRLIKESYSDSSSSMSDLNQMYPKNQEQTKKDGKNKDALCNDVFCHVGLASSPKISRKTQ